MHQHQGWRSNITTPKRKHGSMKCRLFCSIIMMPVSSAGHGLSSFIPQWVLLWLPVPGNQWLCSALPHSVAPCWKEAALHGGTAPARGPQLLLASSDAEPLQWNVRIITERQIMTKNTRSLSGFYTKYSPFLCPCALLGLSHSTHPR